MLIPFIWGAHELMVFLIGIERYTVYLDILELDRGIPMDAGRRKFSVAINMKVDTEETALPSCAPYYPTTTYEDIRIQADLPLAHHLPTTSYLPDLSMQMSSNFQHGPAMAAWNDNNYFIPSATATYGQYPELNDSRFDTPFESNHPSYYPAF
jgi:hypothetical protein